MLRYSNIYISCNNKEGCILKTLFEYKTIFKSPFSLKNGRHDSLHSQAVNVTYSHKLRIRKETWRIYAVVVL